MPKREAAAAGRLLPAVALVLAAIGLAAFAFVALADRLVDSATLAPAPPATDAATIERGAYLARAGNCEACHTARGGARYAGGRGIETPFGVVRSSNLTPDAASGLGEWTSADFWRAMHHGRSRDGRRLYPAFPYPSYTVLTREDSDAIFAYLRSLPAVSQANRPHELRFPYGLQGSLALWRALWFRPAALAPEPGRPAGWERGRYLVRGLGHCAACHAARNWAGATIGELELSGGLIPMQNWLAPSLAAPDEAGVAAGTEADTIALLRDGVSATGSAMGPMAEVVHRSTSHLRDEDLRAIVVYLRELGAHGAAAPRARAEPDPAPAAVMQHGDAVYRDHCADCHGTGGEGRPPAIPPLAGNRAVALDPATNVVKAILHGGFPPSTAGHPMPHGMPPYGHVLRDDEIAAVATYIRQAWGRRATEVSPLEVLRARR